MNKMKLDSFMDFRMLSSLTFSPDGGKLAYVLTEIDREKKEYVSRLRLRTGEDDRPMVSDGRVGEFFFEDEEHILFATDPRSRRKEKDGEEKGPSTVLYRLPLTGGEAEKAYEFPIDAGSFRLLEDGNLLMTGEIRTDDPDFYLLKGDRRKKALEKLDGEKDYEVLTESPFVFNGRGLIQGKRSALFLYQVREKKLRRLTGRYTDVSSFCVRGQEVWYSGATFRNRCPNRECLYRLNMETGRNEQMLGPRLLIYDIGCIGDTLVVIGADGKRYGDNENPCFYTFDPDTKTLNLLCDADESLGNAMLTDVEYGASRFTKADGGCLYFPALDRDGCRLKRIGPDGVIETVAAADGIISDYDVHDGKIVFAGMLDMKLPELYAAEKTGPRRLTGWNAEVLKDVYVAQPQPLTATLDGEEIDGWVLLPEDYDPQKKYPAVLDIHGGPKCAYGPVFFHEMQAWAAKGYIVFFCNPHGSDGRGSAFAYLDLQWGSIDYRQIMAFTDKVLETYPAIDTAKLCCTGGSYGGYMSNWILGHTDRFCCIATQRSIANWVSMYGISDIPPISNFEVCSADPYSEKGFAEMWDVSPLKYVRNAKTPTLIIHSEEDHRCPIAEGYQLYTALVYLRVPARMVVFHGENHELSRTGKPAHRLRRLEEITGWFDKYTR
ncbi:MAG: S9 family peptidase [Clostridia bacterium]|nr:S9 family peptidase [Clostridia bacterium]